MKIAVVILNWNGVELLKQFLPTVLDYSAHAKVYVADNASTDTSVEYVTHNHPEVAIIQNKVNGGFAKGYNDALSHLTEDILILLNSDVQVTPYWLEPIKEIFENETDVAAVQPKILDFKNPECFEYAGAAGGFIDKFGYPYCRGRIFDSIEKDEGQYDDEVDIFWASGACLAIRNTVYREAGGLDEDYFAHQEEIDLCWRIHNLGYRIKYTYKSVIYHVGGATLSTYNPKKTYYNFRNSLYNLVKNVPSNQVLFVVICRMILDGIASLKFLLNIDYEHFKSVFKAHIDFYKELPKLLKKRKKIANKVDYFSKFSVVCTHYLTGVKKYSEL
ncbi:glycosyltransferase family 2 protein [Gillisia sp. M10.2A]|uniref:Glycosyltransferase family 2 protein n=1 Tax=Gillisia lutea TaxID=2909668 RepID=A0ABS9EHJ7_9FLAO|nr:glycosyltransferase family 2 protein [Gillisia lutea]MCF4101235.1 glycosyltransferase family 2 protein [Gillisia lutea]